MQIASVTSTPLAHWMSNDVLLLPGVNVASMRPSPAGDSIFMVSDRNELLRLSARDGSRLWARELPFFTKSKPRRQNEIYAHHGPIIAGGRLIIASNDGLMRFFNPQNGATIGSVAIPGGATTEPVVAGSTLYVVSTDGKLLAFR